MYKIKTIKYLFLRVRGRRRESLIKSLKRYVHVWEFSWWLFTIQSFITNTKLRQFQDKFSRIKIMPDAAETGLLMGRRNLAFFFIHKNVVPFLNEKRGMIFERVSHYLFSPSIVFLDKFDFSSALWINWLTLKEQVGNWLYIKRNCSQVI